MFLDEFERLEVGRTLDSATCARCVKPAYGIWRETDDHGDIYIGVCADRACLEALLKPEQAAALLAAQQAQLVRCEWCKAPVPWSRVAKANGKSEWFCSNEHEFAQAASNRLLRNGDTP